MPDPVTVHDAAARPGTAPGTARRTTQAVLAAASVVILTIAGFVAFLATTSGTTGAPRGHAVAASGNPARTSAPPSPTPSGAGAPAPVGDDGPVMPSRPNVAARFVNPLRVADVLYYARAAVAGLLSYDYRSPAQLADSTATYATAEARARFAGQLGPAAIRDHVVARTTVLAAGITSLQGPDATALAFVDRRVTVRGVARVVRSHVAVRLEERAGRWLVAAVQEGGDPTTAGLPASTGLAIACATARRVVLAFTTWTPGRAQAHLQQLRALASEPFRDALTRAAQPQLRAARDHGDRLVGRVRTLGVALTTGDSAVVLVAVNQAVRDAAGTRVRPLRFQLTIVRMRFAWYVSDLQAAP